MSGPRPLGRSRGGVFAAVPALAAGALTVSAATAPPAAALTPPVGFTADDLATYQTNGIVWSLAEANGVVYAGGTFTNVRPAGSPAGSNTASAVDFAAFDAATGAPTGCSLSLTRSSGTATVRALAVSPDESTLYAGGYFSAVNGSAAGGLVAISTATCSSRAGFAPGFGATVRALDVAANGTVYAGGDFQSVNGQTRRFFGAVTAAGALTVWNPDADDPGRALKATPDGQSVLIGGDFFTVGGANSHAPAVTAAGSGALTRAYPDNFIPPSAVIKDIVTDSVSGGWYVGGEGAGGASFDGRLAMDLATFDQRRRDTCQGATQALRVYRGVLYAGSHVHDCSTMDGFPHQVRKHLTAQSVADPAMLGRLPDTNDGIGEPVGPRALTVSSRDGRDLLWVGGGFTTVNGVAPQALTRFADSPDTGAPSAPVVSLSSPRAGEVRVSWRAGLDPDDSRLTYRVYPSALTAAQVAAHHDLAGTPSGPGDTTVTLTPTEDAYVNGVTASTTYNDSQLASRGTTPYLGYLRFALPAAPAGQELKSARLTFRTSSDSTAGSAEPHRLVPVTGAWTESAVTYNTHPSLAATVLGTISGATAVSTDYAVELNAPVLGGALDSAYSLALTNSGGDSLSVWSSEVATAAYRPQLVLTFGAE